MERTEFSNSETSPQAYRALAGIIIIAAFLSLYNMAAINVAIPEFIRYFNASISAVQWIGIGYTLVMGVVSPLAAYFTKVFTLRRYFIASMGAFVFLSLLSGLCPSIYLLIAVRSLQGFAGMALIPTTMMVIYQYIPRHRQPLFLTVQNMSLSLGPTMGPVLAGFLITIFSWRWVFWLNVPFGLMAVYLTLKAIPKEEKRMDMLVDVPSFVYITIGSFPLLLAFSLSFRWGLFSPQIISMFVFGVIFVTAFVRRQLHMAEPVLEFSILHNREFRIALVGNALLSLGLCLGPFIFSIYFQMVRGYSPLQFGLVLLIPAIFSVGGAPIAQYIYRRRSSRHLIAFGWVFLAGGSLALGFIKIETSLIYVLLCLCVRFFGIGLLGMPITDHGMRELPRDKSDSGATLINWIKLMTTSLSLSIFTLIYEEVVAHSVALVGDIGSMLAGINVIFILTGICFVLGLLLCSRLKSVTPK